MLRHSQHYVLWGLANLFSCIKEAVRILKSNRKSKQSLPPYFNSHEWPSWWPRAAQWPSRLPTSAPSSWEGETRGFDEAAPNAENVRVPRGWMETRPPSPEWPSLQISKAASSESEPGTEKINTHLAQQNKTSPTKMRDPEGGLKQPLANSEVMGLQFYYSYKVEWLQNEREAKQDLLSH